MSVTINGILHQVLPTVEGESARGRWIRGGFVIEYGEEYPRKALFTVFGDEKVATVQSIPVGTPVQVRFCPESRERNERWFTENRCLSVYPYAPVATYPTVQPTPTIPPSAVIQARPNAPSAQATPTPAAPVAMPDIQDDFLPF